MLFFLLVPVGAFFFPLCQVVLQFNLPWGLKTLFFFFLCIPLNQKHGHFLQPFKLVCTMIFLLLPSFLPSKPALGFWPATLKKERKREENAPTKNFAYLWPELSTEITRFLSERESRRSPGSPLFVPSSSSLSCSRAEKVLIVSMARAVPSFLSAFQLNPTMFLLADGWKKERKKKTKKKKHQGSTHRDGWSLLACCQNGWSMFL